MGVTTLLLSIETVPFITARGHKSQKRFCEIECDVCHLHIRRKYTRVLEVADIHTCSLKCRVSSQHKQGLIDKKRKQRCVKLRGVEHHFQAPDVVEKRKQTWLKRLSVDNPMKALLVRQSVVETCLKSYGVPHCWSSPIVREKIRQTLLQRYNVDNAFLLPSVRSRCNSEAARKKSFETTKRTASCNRFRSLPEVTLFNALSCSLSVQEEIQHTMYVSGSVFDIYLKSRNTYVQVDGVYWHGLDRPRSEITQPAVLKKITKDEQENEMIERQGLRVIRITDLAVNRSIKEAVNVILSSTGSGVTRVF